MLRTQKGKTQLMRDKQPEEPDEERGGDEEEADEQTGPSSRVARSVSLATQRR